MSTDKKRPEGSGFKRWFRETFGDWWFRSFIGPAQTTNAVHGADAATREMWKKDLERRKQWSQEQRERKRLAREAERGE